MTYLKDREVYVATPRAEATDVCPARTEVRDTGTSLGPVSPGQVVLAVILKSEAQHKTLLNYGWTRVSIDGLTCCVRAIAGEIFQSCFNSKLGDSNLKKIINEDFSFKKANLKGVEVLRTFSTAWDGYCFAELSKNVGGGGADGQGKAGHCVMVPTRILKTVRKENSKEAKNG